METNGRICRMLHSIPDSTLRADLLKVVALQQRLVKALCALPPKANVDLAWLKSTWNDLPNEWIDRFWNNDKKRRSEWMQTVATASKADKNRILSMWKQQMEFAKLYEVGTRCRLDPCDRSNKVFAALGDLLTNFYAPMFYASEGIPVLANAEKLHKDHFIGGFTPRLKVCPYTDYEIPSRAAKLDHFLPKEKFPALSCHPDNLFPCSTDANNGGRKGLTPPLDLAAASQAEAWFHPRLRSAREAFRLEVSQNANREPTLRFVAHKAEDQPRLENLDGMFHLTETWAEHLDDAVGEIGNTVSGMLMFAKKPANFQNVRDAVVELAQQRTKERKKGSRAQAISESYFYQHVANSRPLLDEVLRACL
jgi:hypothetical protein